MFVRDINVAGAINGQTQRRRRADRGGKGALRTIGTKFKDRASAGIGCRYYRDKEIAGSVRGHAPRIIKPGGESALCSVGRNFKDRATNGSGHRLVHHKEIAGFVKGQVNRITKPGNEGALLSFGGEFENGILV